MKFIGKINIMPRPELLDPQGKATAQGLKSLGFANVGSVRIGKRIQIELEAANQKEAEARLKEACDKLLANLIMESYELEVEGAK